MDQDAGFLMDEPTWAQRVKTVRLRLGVTQTELAARLGAHFTTIAAWETREYRPYSASAEKFVILEMELETEEPS